MELITEEVRTLHKYNTDFSADSVEWCPHEPFKNFFVCANYKLVDSEETEGSEKRIGKILLFSISSNAGLVLHQTLNTAAVLDQKWCHCQINDFPILGVVNAGKRLEIYRLNADTRKLEIVTFYKLEEDDEILLLSLDWSTGKYSNSTPYIVCSDSKGAYHMFTLSENQLVRTLTSKVHNFEAWIAAFYYWEPDIFFTGGDDSILLKYDKRQGTTPIAKNKTHFAGVTCIHSNADKEYVIATGSYDEHLRIWDIRNMKSPTGEIKMPGPLWRIKWDPFHYMYLLAACMLGGAHIVLGSNCKALKITHSYHEHKNITYGADWSWLSENEVKKYCFEGNSIIGTCSFYDHLLCVSEITISEK